MVQESGPIAITANLRDIDLKGLSKATIYKVSGFSRNIDNQNVEIQFKTPLASAVGPYKVNGQILILPIGGEGVMKLNMRESCFHSSHSDD